jgi:putative two-component system response regulator
MRKTIKILHLEDDDMDRELVREMLESEKISFDAQYAKSYKEFHKLLNEKEFDIVLADYSLPSFNGLHALEITKKKHKDLPFIFVSGAIGEELAIKCLKTGATDYILKDQLKKLPQAIERALEENSERLRRKHAEKELVNTNKRLNLIIDEIVDTLSFLAEKKDPYTAGHQNRVSKIAAEIARCIDMPQDKIKGLAIAALLHDIGKFYVPAEILNKPGKLNEFEFNIIKTHAQSGYDILQGIDFPWPVAKAVLQHHELYNGTGYPNGTKGDDILIEARILCVSDVIEAMASDRPYRAKLGIDAALDQILKNKGILYDPVVVDGCMKLFKDEGYKID